MFSKYHILHILKWLELILVDSFAINLSTWHWFYAAPKSKFTLRINSNWQWRAFIYCISISWRRGWNMVCVIYIMISINDGIIIFTKASFLRPSVSNDFYRLCVLPPIFKVYFCNTLGHFCWQTNTRQVHLFAGWLPHLLFVVQMI